MDAIDILGGLLGHKLDRPGKGTDILKDIFKGGAERRPRSRPRPEPAPTGSANLQQGDIERQAEELGKLLNVAHDRNLRSRSGQSFPPPPPHRPRQTERRRSPYHESHRPQRAPIADDDRALVLVRAMVNVAKSDGQIDRSEQETILERMGDNSRESTQFLREEYAKPLDVREFAWSVPVGLEQQVYTLSLIAIDLDTSREGKYLQELAHGLRIPAEVREQIHRRLGRRMWIS